MLTLATRSKRIRWSRALAALSMASVVVPLVASSCGGDDVAENSEPTPDASTDTSVEVDSALPPLPIDDAALADAGPALPSPIKYIVVIEKENHTFDNMFTGFPGADTVTTGMRSNGTSVPLKKAPDGNLPKDSPHSHAAGVLAFANGAMNGFDKLNAAPNELLPFVHYTEEQIPNYWAYARNFVLADQFHAMILGPSVPGYYATLLSQTPRMDNSATCPDGGTVCSQQCSSPKGTTVTVFDPDTCKTREVFPCFDVPTPFDAMPKGFTWRLYGGRPTQEVKSIAGTPGEASHYFATNDIITHADPAKTDLANLSFAWEYSEHPPQSPCQGENWTVKVVNKLMQGPHWNETAIVILYDDWGGFYDHVAPKVEKCPNGEFYSPGFRVPALIISPYAKKGYVLHEVTEQGSVNRLIEDLWGMPRMSARDPHARDGRAGSLLGAFDFTQPPRAPMLLPLRSCPAP